MVGKIKEFVVYTIATMLVIALLLTLMSVLDFLYFGLLLHYDNATSYTQLDTWEDKDIQTSYMYILMEEYLGEQQVTEITTE